METKRISKTFIPVLNNEKVNNIKIEIYYSKGGLNYFTSRNEQRGLYVSVSPVKRETIIGNIVTESYAGFSGIKECVLPLNKFSSKTCENFQIDESTKQKLINHVIEKNNLTI